MAFSIGPQPVANDSLVLYLDAAAYFPPSTTWYSVTGTNIGTLINGPTYNADDGGSIVFDGINDYVATTCPGLSTGTMICFFNPTISNNNQFFEGLIDNDTQSLYGQGMGINNGVFETILDNQFWTPGVSVDIGSWQMCALSWNATTAKFYKNGTLRNTLSYTQGAITTTTYYVGKSYANPRYINGKISIAQIYNRVLSDIEITQNFNSNRWRFGI